MALTRLIALGAEQVVPGHTPPAAVAHRPTNQPCLGQRPRSPGEAGAPLLAHVDTEGKLARAVAVLGPGNNRIGQIALAADGDLFPSGYTEGSVDLDGDGKADVTAADGRQTPFVSRPPTLIDRPSTRAC